eukprot:CAMPEP_0113636818 /NCGR_PEP_ID=MMETSP0017_2-20120614/19231_1 /TAXON_ID=2856 /ORGANISM="Cylindrotheca closterium" /LENGTH=132 /DNA_ID=CAMNT_0000547735 /DNA_START=38 /DNA_END=437 /DNA_ORIENTATION=+ /assembly_acc=CAM_ASM_000147
MSYQSLDFCKYERLRNSTQLPSPYQPATVPHKSMFSSGLNLTKSGMDCMMDAGLMKELTRQGDGSEWMTDKEGWGKVPFNSMLKDKEGDCRFQNLSEKIMMMKMKKKRTIHSIPFLDTDSPWHKAADARRTR